MFRRPAARDDRPAAEFVYRVERSAFGEWWRLAGSEIVVTVDARDLVIEWRSIGKSSRRHTVMLANLVDVVLDTQTAREPLNAGSSGVDIEGYGSAKAVAEVDRTRIVLVLEGGGTIPLTEEHLRYSETTEAFGRLRVFLRKHGWVPDDERAD